jgi:peptidoglycan/LPS O-acetylase OafA/YrhL
VLRRPLGLLTPVEPFSNPAIPGIQGLRALAAVSILTYHTWAYSSSAGPVDLGIGSVLVRQLPLGVTLLFVLSAFLLYRPFAAALIRAEELPSLRRYVANRALRIFPAYWAILLATSFVLQTSLRWTGSGSLDRGALDDPATLIANLLLLQGFHPNTLLTGIGPAWALGVVVTFYAFLPVCIVIAAWVASRAETARGRVLAAFTPALVLGAIGIAGRLVAAFIVPPGASGGWGSDWHSVLERSFLAHADMFAFGVAVAVLHVERENGRLSLPRRWRMATLVGMALVALPTAMLTASEVDVNAPRSNYVYDVVMAFVVALFLAWVVLPEPRGGPPWALVRLLERRAIVSIGVVSYSLFLWHEPLVLWLNRQGITMSGRVGFAGQVILVGSLAFVLSTLTYRYCERPALLRKGRRRSAAVRGRAVLSGN